MRLTYKLMEEIARNIRNSCEDVSKNEKPKISKDSKNKDIVRLKYATSMVEFDKRKEICGYLSKNEAYFGHVSFFYKK